MILEDSNVDMDIIQKRVANCKSDLDFSILQRDRLFIT